MSSEQAGARVWVALVASLVICLFATPAVSNAAAPYEPNDSRASASGPLVEGQTISGGLETENDVDYFKFYVAAGSAQASFFLINTTEAQPDSFYANLRAGFELVDVGGERLASSVVESTGEIVYTLGPGKYYLTVAPDLFNGFDQQISYDIQVRGGVSTYESVQSRCAALKAASAAPAKALKKAKSALKKAKGKKQGKAKAVKKAKAAVKAAQMAFNKAKRQSDKYCFIPQ